MSFLCTYILIYKGEQILDIVNFSS